MTDDGQKWSSWAVEPEAAPGSEVILEQAAGAAPHSKLGFLSPGAHPGRVLNPLRLPVFGLAEVSHAGRTVLSVHSRFSPSRPGSEH